MSYNGGNPNIDELLRLAHGDLAPVCRCGHKKVVHHPYGCAATIGKNRLCSCREFREPEETAR